MTKDTAAAQDAVPARDRPREIFIGIYATSDKCKMAVHMSRGSGRPVALTYLDECDADGRLPEEIGILINSEFPESGKIYIDCTENPEIGQDLEDIVGTSLLEQTRFGNSEGSRQELMRNIKSAMDSGYALPDYTIIKDPGMKKMVRKVKEEIFQESTPGADMAHLKNNTLILAVALSLKAARERPEIPPVPESKVSRAVTRSANHIVAAIVRCLPTKTKPASIQQIQSQTIKALVSLEKRSAATAGARNEAYSEAMALIMDNLVRYVDRPDPMSVLRIKSSIMPYLRAVLKGTRKKEQRRRRAADKSTARQDTEPVRVPDTAGV